MTLALFDLDERLLAVAQARAWTVLRLERGAHG